MDNKTFLAVCLLGILFTSGCGVYAETKVLESLENLPQQLEEREGRGAMQFLTNFGLTDGSVQSGQTLVSRTSSGFTLENPVPNVSTFTAQWITDPSKIKFIASSAFSVQTPLEFSFKLKRPLQKNEELSIPLSLTGTIFNSSSSHTYPENITQNNGTYYVSQSGSFSYCYDQNQGLLKIKALDESYLTDYSEVTLFLNNAWIPVPLRENPMPLKGGIAGNYGAKGSGATVKVKVGAKETSETLINNAPVDFKPLLLPYNSSIFLSGSEFTSHHTARSSMNFLANTPFIKQIKKGKTKNVLDESTTHYVARVVSNAMFKKETDLLEGMDLETYIPIGSSSTGAPITAIAQNASMKQYPEFQTVIKNIAFDKTKQELSFDLSHKKADWQALGRALLKNESFGKESRSKGGRARWITDYLQEMAKGNSDQNTPFTSWYLVQNKAFAPINYNFPLKMDVVATNSKSKEKTTQHIIVDPVNAGKGDKTKATIKIQTMDGEGKPIGEGQVPHFYNSGEDYKLSAPVIKGYRMVKINPATLIDKLGIPNVVYPQGHIESKNIGNIYNVAYEYVKEVPLTYSVIDDTTGETLEAHQNFAVGALNQEANIKENQDKLKAIQESYKSKGYLLGNIENGNLPVPTDEKGYTITLHLTHGTQKKVIDGKSKIVTQTVHYQGAGDETPEDNVQTLTFTSKITQTIDSVTQAVLSEEAPVWSEPQATAKVFTPQVKNYKADQKVVEGTTFTHDSSDKKVTVTYKSTLAPITYTIIDDTLGKILENKVDFAMGTVGEKVNTAGNQEKLKQLINSYTDKGYLFGNSENMNLPAPKDNTGYTITLHFTHATQEQVVDGERKHVTQTIHYQGAGDETPPDNVQVLTFTSKITQTLDNVTHRVLAEANPVWSEKQKSQKVVSPPLKNYVPDVECIPEREYFHESKNKELLVKYKKISMIQPNKKTRHPLQKKMLKNVLPHTGEQTGHFVLVGVLLVIFVGIATQIDKIKALLPKGKKD
ncbi:mucin-binding protein [Lactococcus garvieae]|uniref:mucin-binding protein n=1 Tax=Lactococcus garvieae TaxID=1363 RepID=UPI003D78AA83